MTCIRLGSLETRNITKSLQLEGVILAPITTFHVETLVFGQKLEFIGEVGDRSLLFLATFFRLGRVAEMFFQMLSLSFLSKITTSYN